MIDKMKLSTISLLALAGAASAKVAPLRPVSKFAMAKKTAVELRGESPSDFERFCALGTEAAELLKLMVSFYRRAP